MQHRSQRYDVHLLTGSELRGESSSLHHPPTPRERTSPLLWNYSQHTRIQVLALIQCFRISRQRACPLQPPLVCL